MRQISLLQGKALLVEMPEGAQGWGITKDNDLGWHIPIWDNQAQDWDWDGSVIDLPPGTWQIVGMLSEVTEEQAIPLVERESKPEYSYEQKYPEYVGDEWWYRDYQAQGEGDYKYSHYTALESLESAILAEGYYLDNNPVPPFNERLNDWIEAQSRVLCRERCLVLRRTDI